MAYTATTSIEVQRVSGRRVFIVDVLETEAAAASEWSLTGVPRIGTITLYTAHITAGSATTVQPKLGKVTGWTVNTTNHIAQQDVAASYVRDQTAVRYTLDGAADQQKVFGGSVVNAGADNTVQTRIVIVEGHEV